MNWIAFTLASPPEDDTQAVVRWLGESCHFFDVARWDESRRRWNDVASNPLSDVTHYALIEDPLP